VHVDEMAAPRAADLVLLSRPVLQQETARLFRAEPGADAAGLRVALAGVASRMPFWGGDGRKPVCPVDEHVCGGIAKSQASGRALRALAALSPLAALALAAERTTRVLCSHTAVRRAFEGSFLLRI
jgi:hypothetical protein